MNQMLGLVGLLAILAVGCASAGFDYSTSNDDSSASAAPAASTSVAPQASSEGEGQTVTNSTPSTTSSASEDTPPSSSSSSSYDGPMAPLVELAMVDLSNRMNGALSDITVVSTESMVWPNGALGCPRPDMSYTQVLVDGALIVLSAEGRIFNYHSGGNRDPFLCTPTKTVPGQTSTTLTNNADGGEDN